MSENPILINTTDDAYFVDVYRPHSRPDDASNEHSRLIDIMRKKRTEETIIHFSTLLKPYIPEGIMITAVPPAVAVTHRTGIQLVAKILASGRRIDGVDCLVRTKRIATAAATTDRTIEDHIETITTRQPERIRNMRVLLLDDIQITGNSLAACKQLLEKAGAKEVRTLVLGLNWREETLPERGRLARFSLGE